MRGKIIVLTLLSVLVIAAISNVSSMEQKNNSDNETKVGLPDLVCDIWFEEVNDEGHYMMMFNITNKGTAIAKNWTMNATWYSIGALPFHLLGLDVFEDPLFGKIALFLFLKFHIDLAEFTSEYHLSDFWGSLSPGETIEFNGMFSFYPPGFEFISNANIGFVLIAEADSEQKCNESNENNNQDIERWWLPDFTKPPNH